MGKKQKHRTKAKTASRAKKQQPEDVIEEKRQRLEQKKLFAAFTGKVLGCILILSALFTFVFGIAVIRGEDMYPRMRDGDMYLFYRLENSYDIGDVVTFLRDGKRYTARIVAAGGDTVDMSTEGELLVNGNIQEEEIFYQTSGEDAVIALPCMVEKDSYFLLCDFRTNCEDSRTYGTVSSDQLDGKVITILRRRGI